MTDYIYRLFSGVSGYYRSMNAAYLSGAIDVLVVEQPDGSFRGSPFHVRFGKSASFLPRQLHVDIYVNDQPTDLRMKLGPDGVAFFVRELPPSEPETPPPPPGLVTSPIQSDDEADDEPPPPPRPQQLPTGASDVLPEAGGPDHLPVPTIRLTRAASLPLLLPGGEVGSSAAEAAGPQPKEAEPLSPLSPTPTTLEQQQRLVQCLSDTDISGTASVADHHQQQQQLEDHHQQQQLEEVEWPWGQFPRPAEAPAEAATTVEASAVAVSQGESDESASAIVADVTVADADATVADAPSPSVSPPPATAPAAASSPGGGVYLSDLDPQLSSVYLYAPAPRAASPASDDVGYRSDDAAAAAPPHPHSPPHSPQQLSVSEDVSLSLCGPLKPEDVQQASGIPMERWASHVVTFEEFLRDPDAVLSNPQLVVNLNGRYSNWRVAAPQILSLAAFRTPLPERAVEQLRKKHQPKLLAASAAAAGASGNNTTSRRRRGWNFLWKSSSSSAAVGGGTAPVPTAASAATAAPIEGQGEIPQEPQPQPQRQPAERNNHTSHPPADTSVYVKSARLTSEEISQLGLRPGPNRVEFSVTTAFQGTSRCTAYIYRLSHTDKLVISDVDGTITRSDVLGHLLPMLGRSWSHEGVTRLFRSIRDNGYHMVYLSSRGIGMAAVTRQFIEWVSQEDVALPDGPIMLNPTSLVTAFKKEVIERCPEKFKIECLSDLRSLFPGRGNPIYAGFGNRDTDAIAYTAVGVPPPRIYIINPSSEVSHRHSLVQSTTYRELFANLDLYFPELPGAHQQGGNQHHNPRHSQSPDNQHRAAAAAAAAASDANFGDFMYWRQPVHADPQPPPPSAKTSTATTTATTPKVASASNVASAPSSSASPAPSPAATI